MRGAKGEAVLLVLRTLRNKADAAGSARPEGKTPDFLKRSRQKPLERHSSKKTMIFPGNLMTNRRFYE